jgi:hypothetical protein
MSFKINLVYAVMATMAIGAGCSSETDKPKLSYTQTIAPILEVNCKQCHIPGQEGAEKSGFLVDSYEDVMKGTQLGPVVVPGSAESSTLYRLVSGKAHPSIKMPHGKRPLSKADIDAIKQWIDEGAVQGGKKGGGMDASG